MTTQRRLLILAYGISLFVWLSVEDVTTGPAIFFGFGAAFLISVSSSVGKIVFSSTRFFLLRMMMLGGLTGALSSVTVVALMFFKNARHAHIFPDFPPEVMVAILRRGPVWGLAGVLIGLSLGLFWFAAHHKPDHTQPSL
jgi:hypothetical protein